LGGDVVGNSEPGKGDPMGCHVLVEVGDELRLDSVRRSGRRLYSAIAVSECSSGGIAGTNPRARRFVASPIGRQDGPTVHVERVWPFSATSRRACSIVSSSPSSVVRISETLDWVGPSVSTKAGTRNSAYGNSLVGKESVRFFNELPNGLRK
jgi:hypothetical protein